MKLSSTVTMITEVTGVLSQHPADPIAQSILMSHQSGANPAPGRQQFSCQLRLIYRTEASARHCWSVRRFVAVAVNLSVPLVFPAMCTTLSRPLTVPM